jgi:osmoprotectant transport system permease protein
LTLAALGLGIVISIPIGIWAAQSDYAKQPLLTLVGIIQTIPSVAILALVVALLGGQIGVFPAILALTMYSMLPIVRNTVTGLDGVAADIVEAARGIGMSPSQILITVKLPLAMPVIIAGIRTAAVWTVGLATLSTLVGATSFGNYIFTGLQTRNLVAVTVGSIAAAVMAIGLDLFIGGIQWLAENAATKKATRQYARIRLAVIVAAWVAVTVTAYTLRPQPQADYVVGGKGFTEQYILAGLIAAELEAAGFTVDQRLGMGTEVVYQAVANNTVDVYVEYTGTVWANIMGEKENPGREIVLQKMNSYIQQSDQLVNIGTLGFKNLYAFAMARQRAEEFGVSSIEDLIPIANRLKAAGDLEFFGRPEWATVRDAYDIDFAEKLTFDTALMYNALRDGQVDLVSAYSTDGRIAAFDLILLADPRNAMLPYDSFLLASQQAANDPKLLAAMAELTNKITDSAMQQANKIVDLDGGTISDAVAYLRSTIHN